MGTARVPPLACILPPQVRSLRQLDELMRQLVKVSPRVESAILLAPQLATLAAWGWLFRLLAALRTRGEPSSRSGPQQGAAVPT